MPNSSYYDNGILRILTDAFAAAGLTYAAAQAKAAGLLAEAKLVADPILTDPKNAPTHPQWNKKTQPIVWGQAAQALKAWAGTK